MWKKSILILSIAVLLFGLYYYIQLPDYLEMSSMSFSSQNRRETELNVIVYRYWDLDELVHDIQEQHNRINGIPTELEIRLFPSKWHLRHGKEPFQTVVLKNE